MILAGTETSSSTIANACHLLAHPQNRSAQARLVTEVDSLGAAVGGAKPEAVVQLPYLDAVIKETLRVLPPAHVTAREAPRPMDIGGTPPPPFSSPGNEPIAFSVLRSARS
jgi:cytochrome P450